MISYSLLAAVITLANPSTSAAAPATLPSCSPSGSRTLMKTETTRIFQIRVKRRLFGGVQWGRSRARYGCRRGRGRAYFLGFDDCTTGGGWWAEAGAKSFKVVGPFVGYVVPLCNDFDFWEDLKVVDLRNGNTRRNVSPFPEAEEPSVLRFVMNRRGSLAWAVDGNVMYRDPDVGRVEEDWTLIGKADGRSRRRITVLDKAKDDGPDPISARSLALSRDHRTVLWTRGGQPRTAPIR